jgi:hypothetical protein
LVFIATAVNKRRIVVKNIKKKRANVVKSVLEENKKAFIIFSPLVKLPTSITLPEE